MTWKDRLRSHLLFRNMIADLIGISVSSSKKTFTPYFQYKIGVYQPDYYLYFTSPPNLVRYKNDVYDKLHQYDGYEMIQFLEFHYSAFADKTDFLRFLIYETNHRLKRATNPRYRMKLECVFDWIAEKQKQQAWLEQQQIKSRLEQEVFKAVEKEVHEAGSIPGSDTPVKMQEILDRLSPHLQAMVTATEEKMKAVADAYITGHIRLNNHNNLDKVVHLFYLIQNISAPRELGKGEQVFKQFSAVDIASILHLHFEAFKNKKINTIQGNIKVATDGLNFKDPKIQKLNEALEQFFYS